MSKKEDGGSAFPREVRQEISIAPLDFSKVGSIDDVAKATESMIKNYDRGHGMSLRDYFAAKAMQAGLSTLQDPSAVDAIVRRATQLGVEVEQMFADDSYRMADAMLEARK